MKRLFVVAIFLMCIFVFGATYFTGDFEEGDTTDWTTVTAINGGVLDAHADATRTGSFGSRHYVPSGVADKRAYGRAGFGGDRTEWYVRFYMNINDLIMADGDIFRIVDAQGSPSGFNYILDLERSGSDYQITGNVFGTGPGTHIISKTNWVKIECYCKRETGDGNNDGIQRLTIDDVLEWEKTNDGNTFDEIWDYMEIGQRWQLDTGTEGYMYVDDVLVEDTEPEEEEEENAVFFGFNFLGCLLFMLIVRRCRSG